MMQFPYSGQPQFGMAMPPQQQFQNMPMAPGGLPGMAMAQQQAYAPAQNFAPRRPGGGNLGANVGMPGSPHVGPAPAMAHDDFLYGSEKAVR